ncbi:MAG: hypothetical protein H5T33_00765 [Candidatus Methanosuratus sp.]|nr:hypothetical protein [Candidatus Methanosuratincola sp.]
MPGLDSFIPDSQAKRRQPPRPSPSSTPHGKDADPRRRPAREELVSEEAAGELDGEGIHNADEGGYGESEGDAEREEGVAIAAEAEEAEEIIPHTKFEAETPTETGSCVLLSVSYSGNRGKALAKLYEVERGRIVFWYDNTGHQPYLLTDIRLDELLSTEAVSHPGFDPGGCREVEKHDLLQDRVVVMTKVAAKDPTSIGGRGTGIRDLLGERSWEDRIRYHECFIYDRRLVPGYYYRVSGGSLVPEAQPVPTDMLRKAFPSAPPAFFDSLVEWFPIFSSPVPDYRRVAIDIEVATEAQDRVPDPQVANNPVICVSAAGSDGRNQVLILRRDGVDEGNGERPKELPADVSLVYFDREIDLIADVFRLIVDYPILLTFNGDNFDLHYLWKRAQVLGMRKEEIPIVMGKEIALIPVGIHIDLYKFFHNHAIQIYAFGNAYKELTLDAISEALLGIKKIQLEKSINELDYLSLANYCYRDSLITLRLTAEHSGLVMNLITLIMRISRMSMEDATRQGVSSWIRSLFYDEHRKGNYLIPKKEDISSAKGGSSTTAVIKGKKYKGALVITPQPGVFFNVVVLDFASLYPSIISRWNLSYETVRCPHQECRRNLVPDTDHWVCKKRVGMMSHVVGLLRDVRVRWFKPKSKDPSVSEEEREYYKVVQQALKVFLNACFTGDTEILTVDGPKSIKEVNVGDKVINVNPSTLEPEVDEVIAKQEYAYSGEMIHFENQRTVDLMVTPDHKFLVYGKSLGSSRFVTAQDIFNSTDLILPKLRFVNVEKPESYFSFLSYGKKKEWGLIVKFPCSSGKHVDSACPDLWNFLQSFDGYYHKGSKSYHMPNIASIDEQAIEKIIQLGGFPLLAKFNSSKLNGKQNKLPVFVDTKSFYEFCGRFISEGSLGANAPRICLNGNGRGGSKHIDMIQSEGKGNPKGDVYSREIEGTLKEMKINYARCKKSFIVSNELLYDWLSENCYDCEPHKSYNKIIPKVLLGAEPSALEPFISTLYKGDGIIRQTLYSTKSKRLGQQLCTLLAKMGYTSKLKYDKVSKIYRLTWRNTNQHTDHWKKSVIPFKGLVYCVTTKKNHTVFAGRNGRFTYCGQCYGVFGAEIFPLYCLPLADSTTAIGRSIITETIAKARGLGMDVLYSDTDSIFLHQPTRDQISSLLSWAESKFGIDLEIDKRYTFVTFSGRKKNYLGLLENGVVDIKGLMGKKRNTPPFIKNAFAEMTHVLRGVKSPQDFEDAKSKIKAIVQRCYSDLKARRIPLDDLVFKVMISRPLGRYDKTTPQHVKAAKLLEEKGKEVKPGDLISFVKVQGPLGVKPVQLARIDEIDVDKYIGHIESTFGQVLEALNIDFGEIVGVKKLDFFSR